MRKILFVSIVTLGFLSFSCKENTLVFTPKSNDPTGTVSLKLENAPAGVSRVTASLRRQGFDVIILSLTVSDSTQSARGTFQNVAVGTWHLRVDALDDSNIVRYTGETDVEVFPGETTVADLELLPTSGSVEIHVTWGNGSASDLMLYMPFDGALIDSSGNGNNGTSNNPGYTSDPWGHPNNAYLFNGKDNYITIPNNSTLNPLHQLTITFWLRVDSIQSDYMDILVKGGPVYDYYANREYALYTKQVTTTFWLPQWKSAGDGGGMHELDSDHHSYMIGTWTFFAFIVDRINHRMQIYADGVLTEQTDDSYSSFNVNTYPLIVGSSEENLYAKTPFRGAMDNLRLYNRALTASQILSLFNSHQ